MTTTLNFSQTEDQALAVCSAAGAFLISQGYMEYGTIVLALGAFLKSVISSTQPAAPSTTKS